MFGKDHRTNLELSAGIPQGSVIGPLLWNALFDELLTSTFPPGVHVAAYADDLAVIVTGSTTTILLDKLDKAITSIVNWMTKRGLELAVQKTEILLATGKRRIEIGKIDICGVQIDSSKHVKYLGVILDKNGSFGPHIEYAAAKASKAAIALAKLMPNLKGPRYTKRKILAAVSNSIFLARKYGVMQCV